MFLFRFAVEDWINSNYSLHFVRDHNRMCYKVNGGLWGAVKGTITDVEKKIRYMLSEHTRGAYWNFLMAHIWPADNTTQVAHDAYCCELFPNTRRFPTQRDMYYHYVGEIFNEFDQPNQANVDDHIRGYRTQTFCRQQMDWLFG